MKNGWQKEYRITIDQPLVEEYAAAYKKEHPRSWKPPIDRPLHPLINVWMVMGRPQMNNLKQRWKDFISYVVLKNGMDGLMLDCVEMEFTSYFPTRRRVDPDNTVPKFILDGFTESGLLKDDSGGIIKRLILKTGYDKEHPRTEIIIKCLED